MITEGLTDLKDYKSIDVSNVVGGNAIGDAEAAIQQVNAAKTEANADWDIDNYDGSDKKIKSGTTDVLTASMKHVIHTGQKKLKQGKNPALGIATYNYAGKPDYIYGEPENKAIVNLDKVLSALKGRPIYELTDKGEVVLTSDASNLLKSLTNEIRDSLNDFYRTNQKTYRSVLAPNERTTRNDTDAGDINTIWDQKDISDNVAGISLSLRSSLLRQAQARAQKLGKKTI